MITRTWPEIVAIEMWDAFERKEKCNNYYIRVSDADIYDKPYQQRSQLIKIRDWQGAADA